MRQAAVLPRRERGGLSLVAFVESAGANGDGAAAAADLRAYLRGRLPEPMVPARIVALRAFPENAHGKVDRGALARLAERPDVLAQAAGRGSRTPPRNPTEELLAAIWSEVLEVEGVGVEDDFFALSGHSLSAAQVAFRVREALGVDLPLVRLFERATLGELAAEIDAAAAGRDGAPPPAIAAEPLPPEGGAAPASFLQEWALQLQGGPVSSAMNMPAAYRLRGRLDLGAMRRAFAAIVARHDVLRTTFRLERGEPVQVIAPPVAVRGDLPLVDLSALAPPRREALLRALAGEDARRLFDVLRGPLVTLRAVRLGVEDHALLFNLHHAAGDGWSIEVFQAELAALYGAFARGEPSPLPPLAHQFADFARWQRRALAGEALAAELAYWRDLLADRPPVVDLPADRPRPPVLGPRTVEAHFALRDGAVARLRAAAQGAGCTVSMALTAALQALVHRYTGARDVLVGSIVSGRHRRELAPLIGMFMNSVTVRTDLAGEPTFAELLQRTRAAVLAAYRHQDVPFPALLAALFPEREPHRTLLFRAAINMVNFSVGVGAHGAGGPGGAAPALPGLAIEAFSEAEEPAKYDLLVTCREEPGRLFCSLTGAADLFDPASLAAIRDDYRSLVEQASADPATPLDLLLPDPRHRPAAGARARPAATYRSTAAGDAPGDRERTDPWNL